MPEDQNLAYYSERERAERCMAANAKSPAAAKAHLALADSYRRLADELKAQRREAEQRPSAKRRATSESATGGAAHLMAQ